MTSLPYLVRFLLILTPIIPAPLLYFKVPCLITAISFLFYNWLFDKLEKRYKIEYKFRYIALRYGADLSLFTLLVRYADLYKFYLFYPFLVLIFCWSAILLYRLSQEKKIILLYGLCLGGLNILFYVIGAFPLEQGGLRLLPANLAALVMVSLLGGYFGYVLNLTTLEKEKKEAYEIGILYKISRTLNFSLTFDTIVEVIKSELIRLFSAKDVKIALFDNNTFFILPDKKKKFVLDESLLAKKEPLKLTGEALLRLFPEEKGVAFLFPLIIENNIIGILSLLLEDKRELSILEKKLIYAISCDLSLSLSNALLVQSLKENNRLLLEEFHKMTELREPYSRGHTEKVVRLATKIGEKLGLSEERKRVLRLASLLHDIGKIGVPEKILLKESRLTEEEYEVVKKYPLYGLELLANIKDLQDVLPIIYYHRERYDGKGYIEGRKDGEIPIEARILGLVEAFCAMQELRPWREPHSEEAAVKLIKENKGTVFDPQLVDILLSVYKEKNTT
jgi:HD-GYP domain-containing protein (c-di-GMP phosphodiesterase class II)